MKIVDKARTTAALLALLSIAGCGGPRTAYDTLYAELSEDILVPDASVLEGRRIVIDPGHGGEYEGALGVDSLTESEVNLGVALYLWGLLREAGAEVHLTRSSDRDFLPDTISSRSAGGNGEDRDLAALLRDDLKARSDRANAFEPEVFISIHHNSNIALDRERNAVEVYYRGTDHGASLELAEEIHTHLTRNLGIGNTTIRPGNYFVLRNSAAGAAVLGEASYISNPHVEERLRLSAKQRLEAEAYYLGLVSYFSRGVPSITMTEPGTDTLRVPGKIDFSVEPGAGVAVDERSCEARINGARVPCFFPEGGGGPFCVMPSSMPNGVFSVSLTVRSLKGATATFGPEELILDREPKFFLPLPVVPSAAAERRLEILVLDRGGRPVADGRAVKLTGTDSGLTSAARTSNGSAVFKAAGPERTFTVSSGSLKDTISFEELEPGKKLITVAVDAVTGAPVAGAVMRSASGETAEGTGAGHIIASPGDTAGAYIYAAGYAPSPLARPEDPGSPAGDISLTLMEPRYGGVLHGRRIVLDPYGGGPDDAGRGDGALRGATVNLRLARELEDLLLAAGASVKLTRRGEEAISDEQRVFRTNRFGADLAISLRYGSAPLENGGCQVLHYPGSVTGGPAARKMAQTLTGTPPCAAATTSGSTDLFLLQTDCPAVIIYGGSLADNDIEKILDSPVWTGMVADRMIESLLKIFDESE